MNILLATPAYGGMGSEYVGSMMRLQSWLLRQGIEVGVIHQSMAEVARSRNVIASWFLEREAFTHLLFVDSDMTFPPEAVGKLIAAKKPMVGCVYPKRALDLDRLIAAARRLTDPAQIMASAVDFVVHPGSDSADVVDGLCKVDGIGLGLALIERRVFAELLASGRVKRDAPGGQAAGLNGPLLGFFDPLPTDTTFLAEDLSFCRRWREHCGGEVWAALDQDVGHVGVMTYQGRVIDAFAAGS